MLILLREPGEEVIMKVPGFDDIVMKFLRCDDGVTRFGIQADERIIIMRAELLEGTHGPDAVEHFAQRKTASRRAKPYQQNHRVPYPRDYRRQSPPAPDAG